MCERAEWGLWRNAAAVARTSGAAGRQGASLAGRQSLWPRPEGAASAQHRLTRQRAGPAKIPENFPFFASFWPLPAPQLPSGGHPAQRLGAWGVSRAGAAKGPEAAATVAGIKVGGLGYRRGAFWLEGAWRRCCALRRGSPPRRGALQSGATPTPNDRVTFWYQRPPSVRLQPPDSLAFCRAHDDAEYGHQVGEVNFYPSIYPFICPSVCLSILPSIPPSIHPSPSIRWARSTSGWL